MPSTCGAEPFCAMAWQAWLVQGDINWYLGCYGLPRGPLPAGTRDHVALD